MDIKQAVGHCRWFFFRAGFLYVLVFLVALMCMDVPGVVRSVKYRRINDMAADLQMSQLVSFSKGEIPASAVDWKGFAAYFRLILKDFPAQEVAEMFLGLCEYYGFGQEEKALEHIRHSAQNFPVIFWNVYNTGVIFFKEGDMEQTTFYLQRALILPGDQVMFAMANSIVYRQFFAGASSADLVARLNYARENAVLLLAAAHFYQGNYRAATTFAMKGVTDPGVTDREPFYFYAGAIAMAKGDPDAALAFFDQAVAANSKNPQVYRRASGILRAKGRIEEANKMAGRAKALGTDGVSDAFPYPGRLRLEFF